MSLYLPLHEMFSFFIPLQMVEKNGRMTGFISLGVAFQFYFWHVIVAEKG